MSSRAYTGRSENTASEKSTSTLTRTPLRAFSARARLTMRLAASSSKMKNSRSSDSFAARIISRRTARDVAPRSMRASSWGDVDTTSVAAWNGGLPSQRFSVITIRPTKARYSTATRVTNAVTPMRR